MPYRVNGIGTWYYGHTNELQRPGVCEFCGSSVQLTSYDTRLWICVIFIPVIPLAKKRIINQCAACTRHRVAKWSQFETDKKQATLDGLQAVKDNPTDVDAMKRLHATFAGFGQRDEARRLLDTMAERFPDDAQAQAYIGHAEDFWGNRREALEGFVRALELDPTREDAKTAVGLARVEQGRLDEAAELLAHLTSPGRGTEALPLYSLALAHQGAGHHEPALELFQLLAREIPQFAQDKAFRKSVQTSARATGATELVLPPREYNWKKIITVAAVLAIALLAPLGWNYYVATHREIRVISGFDKPVTVEVAGRGSMTLSQAGMRSLKIAEGKHHAKVTGAVTEEFDITVTDTFWHRFFGKPVFIINPGGAAIVSFEEIYYAPRNAPNVPPGSFSVRYGKSFESFDHVDFAFQPFPKSLQSESKSNAPQRKTRVDVVTATPVALFYMFVQQQRISEALALSEWHLRLHSDDVRLLSAYVGIAAMNRELSRAFEFVRQGCKRRPVEIHWHRTYQHLAGAVGSDQAALFAEYEALLTEAPNDSVRLYLRGRLGADNSECLPYFERAVAADANNAFAHYALAFHHMSEGDWAGARPHAQRAVAIDPQSGEFEHMLFQVRLALGEFAAIETELRAALAQSPLNLALAQRLCDTLIARGQGDAAGQLVDDFTRDFLAKTGNDIAGAVSGLKQHVQYAKGDFAALEQSVSNGPFDRVARFWGLIEQSKLDQAAQLVPLNDPSQEDPFHLIGLAVAYRRAGDAAKSAEWLTKATTMMTGPRSELAKVARVLEDAGPVPLDVVKYLSLQPRHKAIVLCALAERFPDHAGEYLELARLLNVERIWPYHLVAKVAGQRQSGK